MEHGTVTTVSLLLCLDVLHRPRHAHFSCGCVTSFIINFGEDEKNILESTVSSVYRLLHIMHNCISAGGDR